MANVRNLANQADAVDISRHRINRTGTASPQGSVTPLFSGEHYYDTSAAKSYRAYGTANTDWEQVYPDTSR